MLITKKTDILSNPKVYINNRDDAPVAASNLRAAAYDGSMAQLLTTRLQIQGVKVKPNENAGIWTLTVMGTDEKSLINGKCLKRSFWCPADPPSFILTNSSVIPPILTPLNYTTDYNGHLVNKP